MRTTARSRIVKAALWTTAALGAVMLGVLAMAFALLSFGGVQFG